MTIFDYIRWPISEENFEALIHSIPEEIIEYWRATPTRSRSDNIKEIQELIMNYQTNLCCVNDRFTPYDPNN